MGRYRLGMSVLTAGTQAFLGVLGARVVMMQTGRSREAKGLLERAYGYLENSFPPGQRFAGPADFKTQLASAWEAYAFPSGKISQGQGNQITGRW